MVPGIVFQLVLYFNMSEHLADVSARRARCGPQVYSSLRAPSRYTLEVVIRAYLASAPSWVSLPATRPRVQSGTQQQDKQKLWVSIHDPYLGKAEERVMRRGNPASLHPAFW